MSLPSRAAWRGPAFDRFCAEFANFAAGRSAGLSFDLDFAPDYMIAHLLDLLSPFAARATFFCTHATPLLSRIAADPRYELALHPYDHPSSTQGGCLDETLARLRALLPDARGSRFHRLAHAYASLAALARHGLAYDASTLRLDLPYALPAWHPDLPLVLLPYTFEDGVCEASGRPLAPASVDLASPGMKGLAFHPLNVFLDAPDPGPRKALLAAAGPLPDCPRETAERFRDPGGAGAGTLLRRLLEHFDRARVRTYTCAEAADAFRELLDPAAHPRPEGPSPPASPRTVCDRMVRLRRIEREDLPTLYRWRTSPEIRARFASPPPESFAAQVAWFERTRDDPSCGHFVAERDGVAFGALNYSGLSRLHRTCTVGWFFAEPPGFPLRDLPVRACLLLLDRCFGDLAARKIFSDVLADNLRARRFDRGLGFREEGLLAAHVLIDGQPADLVPVALFPEEYARATSRLRRRYGLPDLSPAPPA